MNNKPVLSIVTPTRGDFSGYWFSQLLRVEGNIEFIIVYPPGMSVKEVNDARVRALISPYKGEVMQRAAGILNAQGNYVLALDDDDFVHPDIFRLVIKYFEKFPQSWVLRLRQEGLNSPDITIQDWGNIANPDKLDVCEGKWDKAGRYHWWKGENASLFNQGKALLSLPIAPLKRFANQRGIHMENSVSRVWKREMIQKATTDFLQATKIFGPFRWMPSWSLDRALGLFIQAKFFKKNMIIGHWMPLGSVQIEKIQKPSAKRVYLAAEILLLKRFPQYLYFWNLVFSEVWGLFKRLLLFTWKKYQ